MSPKCQKRTSANSGVTETLRGDSGTGVEVRSRRLTVRIDDCFGKVVRGFLRQIVADAALDGPVRISAREFFGVGAGLRVWRALGVAFHRDGGHGDHRSCGKPLFEVV